VKSCPKVYKDEMFIEMLNYVSLMCSLDRGKNRSNSVVYISFAREGLLASRCKFFFREE
jgi:hypothetical protein